MMVKSNKRRDEERRTAAAIKVAEMQRAQKAADRRRRSLMVSAIAVAAIVVVVVVVVLVETRNSSPKVQATRVGGATADYGFVVGKKTAPATLISYEDFQCPICQQFENTDGELIQKYITAGKLKVEYRPIAILDRESSTQYSTRALNAAACVSNYSDMTVWKTFHDLLFKNQPPEGGDGLPDSQLVNFATEVGAKDPAVATCITDQTYKNWTVSATDAASKAGVSGTPTVKLNGKDVSLNSLSSPAALTKLLDAAVAANTK